MPTVTDNNREKFLAFRKGSDDWYELHNMLHEKRDDGTLCSTYDFLKFKVEVKKDHPKVQVVLERGYKDNALKSEFNRLKNLFLKEMVEEDQAMNTCIHENSRMNKKQKLKGGCVDSVSNFQTPQLLKSEHLKRVTPATEMFAWKGYDGTDEEPTDDDYNASQILPTDNIVQLNKMLVKYKTESLGNCISICVFLPTGVDLKSVVATLQDEGNAVRVTYINPGFFMDIESLMRYKNSAKYNVHPQSDAAATMGDIQHEMQQYRDEYHMFLNKAEPVIAKSHFVIPLSERVSETQEMEAQAVDEPDLGKVYYLNLVCAKQEWPRRN